MAEPNVNAAALLLPSPGLGYGGDDVWSDERAADPLHGARIAPNRLAMSRDS
jgi:hypothetical protein